MPFLTAPRGPVGDLFPTVIYLLECSLRAQSAVAPVPRNCYTVSAGTTGMSAVENRRVEYRNSFSPGGSPAAKLARRGQLNFQHKR